MTLLRKDIDGLRAVAVLLVLAFHLGVTAVPGGYVGVDVFFVISGYLITGLIRRDLDAGSFSLIHFYERRLRRLAPALFTVLIATTAIATLLLMPYAYREFAGTLLASLFEATNFLFLKSTGYFDPGLETAPLLHLWSLAVEEQYYLLFPLLMMAGYRNWPRHQLRAIQVVALISLLISLAAAFAGYEKGYFLLPMRFWEIAAGALLALMPGGPSRLRNFLPPVGLLLIGVSATAYSSSTLFPGYAALLPVAGSLMVIAGDGPVSRVLASAPLVAIGRISYPLYLWHWPIIVFWAEVSDHPLTGMEAGAIALASFGLAVLTYVFVEQPIRRRRWLASASSLVKMAGAIALVLAAVAILALATRGLPQRLSEEARVYIDQASVKPAIQDICPHGRRDMAKDLPPCLIGDAAAGHPSFAIIGDSHSEAMAGAIGDLAAKFGLQGLYLGRIACLPFADVDRRPVDDYRCAEHLDFAISEIKRRHISTVFIIARWAVLHENRQRAADLQDNVQFFDKAGEIADANKEKVLGATLGQTIDRLGARDVSVMFSVPEAPFDVPSAFARAASLGRNLPAGPTVDLYEKEQAAVRRMMTTALAGRSGVQLLEPRDLFCATGRCQLAEGDQLFYVDYHHPSRAGADRLAVLFEPALRRLAASIH